MHKVKTQAKSGFSQIPTIYFLYIQLNNNKLFIE